MLGETEKIEQPEDITRNVLFEKIPFIVALSLSHNCGFWYGSYMDGQLFKVINGGSNFLRKYRSGYNAHLTKHGFYIIVEGKLSGNVISKIDAVKIKNNETRIKS